MKQLEDQLTQASEALRSDASLDYSKTLPIGVGLLTFILEIDGVLPILVKFNPAII